jgi:signal transduction histidine kinase
MATSSFHEATTTLAALILKQVEEFSDRFGIRTDCELEEVDKVPPRMSVEILRIVQEALNNARKHASARRVVVRMELRGGGVVVSVADDGMGFDPAVASPGYGRQSMQERAESLNGELTITSAPGLGTTVRLQVPVARLRISS